ncbi:hypothetical protein BE15_04335, partial [Sorangium cellulosum]
RGDQSRVGARSLGVGSELAAPASYGSVGSSGAGRAPAPSGCAGGFRGGSEAMRQRAGARGATAAPGVR